ncbi:putative PPE family protein PPE42 [Mycobacterium pseudokansasii]|uniref:Putative PPE family protein PPE42 n=2 Tax=Mycobacterium pseudokansasii TaxID=2341080 RepID=A0A498QQA0_9MYCO|nr:putative PPE family protein PPE42 [Mycobacterium pseudokansasii]VAZ95204.1 putative PPE family protein PPE42 [Mycobacterium pseudokansasii]VBA50189.1 putative PPE family protein PPE42 [Mycobacterium pseudokansasii]
MAGMSFVLVEPDMMASAASDVARIGAAISAANDTAAATTTQLLAAGADEVSQGIAALFAAYARDYQAVSAQIAAYHDHIVRALGAGAEAYAGAEAANRTLVQPSPNGTGGGGPTVLIMGPTGNPGPSFRYLQQVYNLYIRPFYPGSPVFGVTTPEQFQPFTGIPSLTFDESVAAGAADLHAAIMAQHAAGHDVVVLGFSQSASVATAEMRYLASLPADLRPGPDQLSFVLLGDPNNPNGGLLARFPGLFVQPMGLTFSGATPSNLYPTTVYTRQYDGFADFPQYPLNIPADLNALLGIYYAHGTYQELTPAQIGAGVVQPVSPDDVYTTYILLPSDHLPLLQPLRGLVPAPLLDLVEPDLRAIIELGYDRTGYADVPTPAGLFPTHIDALTLAGATAHGIDHALADVGLPPLPKVAIPDVPLPQPPSAPTPAVPAALPVPPQIGGAIDGPLEYLPGSLDTVINDTLDPALTSAMYQAGDSLLGAALSQGASPQLINAIVVAQQMMPVLVEGPGYFVTADAQYLAEGIGDLAAGDLNGFSQNMQLIPATNITLSMFGAGIAGVAIAAIVSGQPFPT